MKLFCRKHCLFKDELNKGITNYNKILLNKLINTQYVKYVKIKMFLNFGIF